MNVGEGRDVLTLSTGVYPDGTLGEIFLDYQREGTFGRDVMGAFAMAVSIALQHGTPISAFIRRFKDYDMQPDLMRSIFQELERHYN